MYFRNNEKLPPVTTVFGGDPVERLEQVLHRQQFRPKELRSPLPLFPNGWLGAMFSGDLAVGQVVPLRLAGREIVVFRGEDGQPRALDAFCAHLGAHLGHGGTVKGNDIVCPFHDWRWSGEGKCKEIPYSRKIPAAACMPAYEVRDRNGFIFVWVHAENLPPTWEIQPIPEIGAPDYRLVARRVTPFGGHVQDVVENGVDLPHFRSLHKWSAKSIDWQIDGPTYTMVYELDHMRHERDNGVSIWSKTEGTFTHSRFWGAFHGLTAHTITQMDEGVILLQQLYFYRTDVPEEVAQNAVKSSDTEWGADIPIWENKVYRPRPVLTGDDGPVGKYRHWFSQFYSKEIAPSTVIEDAADRKLSALGDDGMRIGAVA